MSSLVSIVIPAWNAAPWLDQAIDSAIAQTHTETEIIVVDDGSTDNTLRIARAREAQGVIVLTQPNAGASAARNLALRRARGEFIQHLDADDLISPGKIAAQIRLLSSRPAGNLATCRWGRFTDAPSRARFVDEAVFRDFSPIDYLLLHTGDFRMMHPAAWLVPKAVAERAGPWDERLSLNDDGEYFARVVMASTGIAFADDSSAATYYRSGIEGNLSGRRTPRALASLGLSAALISDRLLAAEDSPRTRRALANYWQRLGYELYPEDPHGSRQAMRRARAFGGSRLPPPLGPKRLLLSRLLGWRLVSRLFPR